MTTYHESKIADLIGFVDGSNRDFETPTPYKAGTIRVFINGQEVPPTDSIYGWVEISQSVIRLNVAPRTGDDVDAFYQDKTPAEVLGLEDVRGSPFYPGELP